MDKSYLVSFVTTVALLGGCTMSDLAPDEEVQVQGRLINAQGEPASGVGVSMMKSPDVGEILGGILLGPVTILACLGSEPPPICEDARITTTQADGSYLFDLLGKDTQGSIGNASEFFLAAELPRLEHQVQGPSILHRFIINEAEREISDLAFWSPDLEVQAVGQALQVSLDQVALANDEIRFLDSEGIASLWTLRADGQTPLSIDSRLLEDKEVSVLAVRQEYRRGDEIHSEYRSARLSLSRETEVPPSRNARCYIDGEYAELCLLTDGNFSNVQVPSPELEGDCQNSICTSAEEIAAIDLGSVEEIEMVVVRSANEAEVQVLVSQDGESWQAYGDAARGEFFLKEDASARFVGVEATGPDAQLFLSELSVW